jgi:hypothetical protein
MAVSEKDLRLIRKNLKIKTKKFDRIRSETVLWTILFLMIPKLRIFQLMHFV